MACGVHLGILLICFIQAEHVRCLWATQALGQNGNTHVGFSRQRGGLGSSYPQNQLRHVSGSPGSTQSSSFNRVPEVSGYSQRFPSSRSTQTVSRPAKSVFASGKLVQSSSESKPHWQPTKWSQGNVQKIPKKKPFAFSGSIAGGSSLSKYDKTPISEKRTRPVQQGTPSRSSYQSSSPASLQSHPGSFKSSAAPETPVSSGRKGSSPKSSSQSRAGAAASRRIPVRTKTSASVAARRVSSRRRPKPSQTRAVNPGQLVPVSVSNLPSSWTSSTGTSGQGFAPSRTYNIPQSFGGFAIRRLKEPADQKEVSVGKPQQVYVAQQPPAALKPAYVAPLSRFAPLKPAYVTSQRPLAPLHHVYTAPQRPLAPPLHPAYVAPQRTSASFKPQVLRVRPEASWKRFRPRGGQ